jgi:histidyl-tRNA synthetase
MRDVLPDEGRRWRTTESRLESVLTSYAYEEVHLPLLEYTELFSRGVGEATDIVEKEMYSFDDRDGDSVSLRPEGTAGCVRLLQQHGLLFNQTQRVFYRGPMFRYERPQRGRYRQFYQLGAEAFGMAGPDVDAELIALGEACWKRLGIDSSVRLQLNTLGSHDSRIQFRQALVGYLEGFKAELDDDSRRRLSSNPLRILDSKSARTQEILDGAPSLMDYVDDDGRAHFDALRGLLDELGIAFELNPRLVRGLDYYNNTVFEWVTDELGAQGTICAGGRYDSLVELLGGKPTPAAGFALGLDRVLLLVEQLNLPTHAGTDVYVCVMAPQYQAQLLGLADRLREALPEFRIRVHSGGGKLKNQLKKADQSGARWALMVGEDEVRQQLVTLKTLTSGEQVAIDHATLIEKLRSDRT